MVGVDMSNGCSKNGTVIQLVSDLNQLKVFIKLK